MDPNVIWFAKFYKCGIKKSKIWLYFWVNYPKVLFYAFDFMTTHRKINLGTCNTQYNGCKNGIHTFHLQQRLRNNFLFFFWFTFTHLADAFIQSQLQLHSGYTFLISMCVPWEPNPQPFCVADRILNHWATQEHWRIYDLKNLWHIYDTLLHFTI